jgi:hypothetical protein
MIQLTQSDAASTIQYSGYKRVARLRAKWSASFRHVGGLTVSVWLMINPDMTKKISTPAGKIALSAKAG